MMLSGKFGKFFVLGLASGTLLLCGADDMSGRRERGGRSFNRESSRGRDGRNMGAAMYGRIIAEQKIAAAFPEKYAALEAAREKYEAELAALAKEAKVELPAQRDDALRQIRKKNPAEFAAVMREIETSPFEGMRKLQALAEKSGVKLFSFRSRGGRRGFDNHGEKPSARKFDRPDMGRLRRKYPELMREYDELRKEDYQAARKKLLEIIEMDRKSQK